MISRIQTNHLNDVSLESTPSFFNKLLTHPNYITLRLEYCDALITHLAKTIEEKLKAAEANQNNMPWQLGHFGSRSNINFNNKVYYIPKTIKIIIKLLNDYQTKKADKCINNNVPNGDALLDYAELVINKIYTLLESRVRQDKPYIQSFLESIKQTIGIGTTELTLKL